MRRTLRTFFASGLVLLLTAMGLMITGRAVMAAPGDAAARGVVLGLNATVFGVPIIAGNVIVGSAQAPPGGGTDQETTVPVTPGVGAIGVVASGVVDVIATRGLTASSSSATVDNFALSVLGLPIITATEINATATCPVPSAQVASTTLNGLQAFGSPVVVNPNTPATTYSAPVAIAGIVGAELSVAFERIETTTVGGALALALRATLTITGTIGGLPVSIPVGTVILAEASCERPLVLPTASSIVPNIGPAAGGQAVTITGTNFVQGGTTVNINGVPATNVVVNAAGTSLTAVTPPGAVGPAAVVVITPGGTAPALPYTYLNDGSGAAVANLFPNVGTTAGGTGVTISGTGLAGATGVTVGGAPAIAVFANPAGTFITFLTPPSPTAGPAPVVIQYPAGTVLAPTFTYVGPTITSVVPAQGPAAGGTAVTITGTGLSTAGAVAFDGALATIVGAPTDTTINVITPAHAPGVVDVVVALTGLDVTGTGAFAYNVPGGPTITTVAPNTGPTSGGTSVTITGTDLAGTTAVTFGGLPATIVGAPTATTVTVTTPISTPGLVAVAVATPGGTSTLPNAFTYVAPTLTSIVPASGPQSGGTPVVINGTGLQATTDVRVNSVPVPFAVNPAGTQITITTPAGPPGPVPVEISIPGAVPPPLTFTYLYDGSIAVATFVAPPAVPTSGGTVVTITGTGLTGATGVTFAGIPGTDVVVNPAGTSIQVTAPANEISGATAVVLVFPAGTAPAGNIAYIAPTITDISPDGGPTTGSTEVTITGTGLATATEVSFDGTPATIVGTPTDTSITVTTAPHTAGTVDVTVTLTGLDVTAVAGYTYIAVTPTITSIDPNSGPAAGGQTVTITGTGFAPGATTMTFNGVLATDVVVDSPTSLTAVTPAGTPGTAAVVVTVAEVPSVGINYQYIGAPVVPVITTLNPDSGLSGGGTVVTITGTGFVPGQTSVTICGQTIPADRVSVNDDGTRATFTTPGCKPDATELRVTTPGGTSGPVTFTYIRALPVTGTNISLYVYGGLALIVVGGLLAFLTYRRRRRFAE